MQCGAYFQIFDPFAGISIFLPFPLFLLPLLELNLSSTATLLFDTFLFFLPLDVRDPVLKHSCQLTWVYDSNCHSIKSCLVSHPLLTYSIAYDLLVLYHLGHISMPSSASHWLSWLSMSLSFNSHGHFQHKYKMESQELCLVLGSSVCMTLQDGKGHCSLKFLYSNDGPGWQCIPFQQEDLPPGGSISKWTQQQLPSFWTPSALTAGLEMPFGKWISLHRDT